MLKVVEQRDESNGNVIAFPTCQSEECRYALQCPVREKLYQNPDANFSSALFVAAEDGKISVNGLSNVTEKDARPLMRVLGAALMRLCVQTKAAALRRIGHDAFLRQSKQQIVKRAAEKRR